MTDTEKKNFEIVDIWTPGDGAQYLVDGKYFYEIKIGSDLPEDTVAQIMQELLGEDTEILECSRVEST